MVGFNINYPAEVAQVVEHGTENAGVDSSSLSLGTTPSHILYFVANVPVLRLANARFADIYSDHPSRIALAKALAASFCQPGNRWPYTSPVVLMLAWPSLLLTRSKLSPFYSITDAWKCLRSCTLAPCSPSLLANDWKALVRVIGFIGLPSPSGNTRPWSS